MGTTTRSICILVGLAVLTRMSVGYVTVPTPDGCKCLPHYQCANGTVIEDGATLIDIRIKVEDCENYLDVCCKVPKAENPDDKGKVDYGEKDSWGSCGVRHPEGVAFKITGDKDGEAQFGEFPWMTAILKEVEVEPGKGEKTHKTSRKYICGGSLIHPNVVMTGAHCVHSYKEEKLIVRVGEWDSQTDKEIYHHQERDVYKIIVYSGFVDDSLHNDIALLYSIEPIKPAKHIGIVCLPDKKQSPPPKTRCLASGWGATEFGKDGKYSSILKKVELPVVEFEECQDYLRKTRLGYHFKLHESFMCAGGEKGRDTCKGDGGSPLVCPHPYHKDHYIQAGIVAWGIGCNDPKVPGVYADVSKFKEWIDEKMKELDLDSSYYSLYKTQFTFSKMHAEMARNICLFLGVTTLLVLTAAYEDPYLKGYEVIPTPEDCKCLPYYQCSNGSVIEDGSTLIDIRIRVEACENYIDVCCKLPNVLKPEDKGKSDYGEEKSWGRCGVRHPKGVAFKITGDKDGEAQFGEFPWMTAILKEVKVEPGKGEKTHKTSRKYICGGSLIHPNVVMTGAHCVHSYTDEKLIVRVGEWDSQTNKEVYQHQEREVYKIIVYPGFQKDSLHNDMALLYFTEPIKPAKHIGIVCLPDKDQSPPPETRCLASGWGAKEFEKEGKYSTILKKVELPVVHFEKCQDSLRKTRLGYHFKLHESFMCAGGEKGKDTCKGDGGSPLVCLHPYHKDHYIQAGIVAWGIGCNDPGVPGVYADVVHFRGWIDEKMWELSLDKSYYSLSK
ncbi:uncharacterized protein LOC124155190 [Ischnura elegans]|uniref:uncharacterized protein LOC124155190 n=1 Tax=Ischnura elegans TaxID=197161 RepID=UPI001ED87F51|nr:uncharacterized protein LOC124155190 [Ischnura elegans]